MHVHVAVDDPEKAIQVVNGLLPQLGPLLALSASSPFWRGEPTGLASSRQMVFAAFPRSGPPPRFRDYADYAEVVGQLERTGCIADYTHIWWDVRLHPLNGTIEIRICDAVTRLEDACGHRRVLPGDRQAAVRASRRRRGDSLLRPDPHGGEQVACRPRPPLEAPVMDLATGSPEPHPRLPARPAHAARDEAARPRARLRARARGHIRDPHSRQQRRAPAPRLQRQPRHRGGRASRSRTPPKPIPTAV